jgi:hypothetical protein
MGTPGKAQTCRSALGFWILLQVHSLVRPTPRAFFRPDRQILQPPRAGGVKAGRQSARKAPVAFPGRALTAPSTAASYIGRDRKAPHLSHVAGGNSPHQPRQQNPALHQELRRQSISRGVAPGPEAEGDLKESHGESWWGSRTTDRRVRRKMRRASRLAVTPRAAARRSETRSGRPSDV